MLLGFGAAAAVCRVGDPPPTQIVYLRPQKLFMLDPGVFTACCCERCAAVVCHHSTALGRKPAACEQMRGDHEFGARISFSAQHLQQVRAAQTHCDAQRAASTCPSAAASLPPPPPSKPKRLLCSCSRYGPASAATRATPTRPFGGGYEQPRCTGRTSGRGGRRGGAPAPRHPAGAKPGRSGAAFYARALADGARSQQSARPSSGCPAGRRQQQPAGPVAGRCRCRDGRARLAGCSWRLRGGLAENSARTASRACRSSDRQQQLSGAASSRRNTGGGGGSSSS